MSEARVLIVGAGPVGLVLAAELARHGVRPRVVERRTAIQPYSRAVAIQPRTLEALAPSGLTARLQRRGLSARRFHLVVGKNHVVETFEALDTAYPEVLLLPQGDTERILQEYLGELGVHVETGTELSALAQFPGGVEVTLRHPGGKPSEHERFDWVVGCDGAHSSVRQAIGAEWVGADLSIHFAIADLELEFEGARDETWLFVGERGLCALFPMPGSERSFRVIADFPQHYAPELTLERVRELLADRTGRAIPADTPSTLVSYSVKERAVDRWRVGRALLAGDAAHVHSPIGGQGMNTGIQDAHNLAWKLALVTLHDAPVQLLDSYESERRPVAERVIRDTHRATTLATARGAVAQALRAPLFGFLAGYELPSRTVLGRASEVDVAYRRSPIVGQRGGGSELLSPGDHVPNVVISAGVELRQLLSTRALVVLLFDGGDEARAEALAWTAEGLGDRWPGRVQPYVVVRGGTRPDAVPRGTYILDPHGALHDGLGARPGAGFVIRPDGYLGFVSLPATNEALSAHLASVLG